MELTNVRWWGTNASQHLVQHSWKLRILYWLVQRKWLPTPSLPPYVPSPGVPFVVRTLYRRSKILVAAPSGRCTGGGFINEVLLAAAQSVGRGNLWDNRAPGLLYDCPRDMSSSLQIIAR